MLMKQQNITVKQIQEYLNLSCVQGIYHWLDGTSMPTVDNLYALSELFEGRRYLMRDITRIEPMLEEIKSVWEQYPDLRLGQLICDIVPEDKLITTFGLKDNEYSGAFVNTVTLDDLFR